LVFGFIDAADKVTSQSNDLSASVWQAIPTGGAVSITLSGYKSESNRSFQTINPRYGSTLSLSFSQPLLRNFGNRMSRREIIISLNNKDISESHLQSVLLDTVYGVEQAYWNLIYAIEPASSSLWTWPGTSWPKTSGRSRSAWWPRSRY
jgi:outer membrane protein TolC